MQKRIDRGFTLVELLLTIIVISVGLVGIMYLFDSAARGAFKTDFHTVAAHLCREKLERIVMDKVRDGYSSIDSSDYPTEALSGNFGLYTRNTQIAEVSSEDFQTALPGSGYKRVTVTVSWGGGPAERVVVSTVLASY